MQDRPFPEPKPVTDLWRPQLTRLPRMTPSRRAFRVFSHGLLKFIANICLKVSAVGMENFLAFGPLLVVMNHLGDSDVPALILAFPYASDVLGMIELFDVPILGILMI